MNISKLVDLNCQGILISTFIETYLIPLLGQDFVKISEASVSGECVSGAIRKTGGEGVS